MKKPADGGRGRLILVQPLNRSAGFLVTPT